MGKLMQLRDRIGKRIRLQDMHILMAVIQAGSMGKAARRLNMSQPNISKSVADLERELGVRLLDRYRQGVKPTEGGRALLDGGTIVFDELRQTVKNIEFFADPAAGEVRIGCTPTIAESFGAAVIDRLSRRYPRIVFHLVTGYAEGLHLRLHERSLDLLFARKPGPIADEHLNFEFLFDDRSVVVAGGHSPWARRRTLTLAELVNEPWVLPPRGRGTTSIAMEAFAASGLHYPRATVIVDGPPQARLSLLTSGRFLTIVPASTLRFPAQRPEIRILPVELALARMPIGVFTLKNRTLTPTARLFIETARDVAKPLARRK
jgi:DNA-binding transcriptional LysR family regulator